jgi:hypothetical protein
MFVLFPKYVFVYALVYRHEGMKYFIHTLMFLHDIFILGIYL